MKRTLITTVAAGTALGLGGVASAQDSDRTSTNTNTSTELSSLDLNRAYASELSADSLARRSAQADRPESAGFTLTSGPNSLNIGGLFQFGYNAGFRDESADNVGPDQDFTQGFLIRRARLDFSGNLINDRISYRISGDFGEINSTNNSFNVTWAYGEYAFEDALEGLSVRFGQFKLPLFYEELVEPEYQLTVDRSLTNELFSQQYSQGLMFTYATESWRAHAAVSDGLNTAGSTFNSPGDSDIALTGRIDAKLAGDWAAFDDFTSFRNSDDALRVGAAVHWEHFGDTNPATSGNSFGISGLGIPGGGALEGDLIVYTVDAQFESNGWNVFAAFYGASVTNNRTGAAQPNDFGAVVQGGYFLTDQVELFARYDALFLDDEERPNLDEDHLNFLTAGATYYFVPESHALKFTTDVTIAFNSGTDLATTGTGNNVLNQQRSDVTGLLGQTNERPEIAVRAQLSLTF
mgnify:CR=1 FL=1